EGAGGEVDLVDPVVAGDVAGRHVGAGVVEADVDVARLGAVWQGQAGGRQRGGVDEVHGRVVLAGDHHQGAVGGDVDAPRGHADRHGGLDLQGRDVEHVHDVEPAVGDVHREARGVDAQVPQRVAERLAGHRLGHRVEADQVVVVPVDQVHG